MTNWTELKRLAEEAITARPGNWYTQDDCCWWTGNADEGDFIAAVNPKTILALIAENERLKISYQSALDDCKARWTERDQARAEMEALRKNPVAWRCFDGEGNYDYTGCEETAERWRAGLGSRWQEWLEPLYDGKPE